MITKYKLQFEKTLKLTLMASLGSRWAANPKSINLSSLLRFVVNMIFSGCNYRLIP